MNRNVADSDGINVSAFVCDNVDMWQCLNDLFCAAFDLGVDSVEERSRNRSS